MDESIFYMSGNYKHACQIIIVTVIILINSRSHRSLSACSVLGLPAVTLDASLHLTILPGRIALVFHRQEK